MGSTANKPEHSTRAGNLHRQDRKGNQTANLKAVPAASGKWNRDGLPNGAMTEGGYEELGGTRGRGGAHD